MVDRRPDLPRHADQLRQPADRLGAGAGDYRAPEADQPGVCQHHQFLSARLHGQPGALGKLYDRVGNRRGFSISIVVWSLASMLHAFATGLFSLNCFRFLLGLGEAGNWPGAAKVIAEWFPIRQRALGMAIFNSGTSIGSVVAPPLIIALQLRFGWQTTFLAVGALGFLWLVLWLRFYHPPERHPRITAGGTRTDPRGPRAGRRAAARGSSCCATGRRGLSCCRGSAATRSGGCTSRGCRSIYIRFTASA